RGALFEPVRQGNELRGYCEGSGYEPYRVSTTLGPAGVEAADCTCPYDWGGICKHIVALLLAWVHEPESFHAIPPLDELLAGRSQEELIALIKEMLKRQPDLVRLLELPVQPDRPRGAPLDLDAFRRQIGYALRRSYDDYGYPRSREVATELSAIVDTARRFREAGDWANAGALFHLILNEVVPQYDELYDEDGDISIVLQDCAEGLGGCFSEGTPAAETRRLWLEALLEAHLKDIDMGGIDLAPPAGEVVIEQATDEEWTWIEARVQEAIAAQTGRYSNWPRESLVSFLAARLAATGQEGQIDDLVFAMGSVEQQAFLLVRRGRFEEAVGIAQEHFSELPGLVIQFADALVEAGAGAQAEAYIAGLLDTRGGSTYLAWLAQRAEQKGEPAVAVDWWRQSIQQAPSFQTYQTLRQLAQQLGQWDHTRAELLAELEAKGSWAILIEVALDEEDIPRALELLPRLRGWYGGNFELRVAQAAEAGYPQAALDIYRSQAERLIDRRGRENYRAAAGLLARVRGIYRRQKDTAAWEQYVASLREEHRRLRALQDELNKAGL
ncbi:MAG: SWIM zinc finger domain-containing protein, partial [Anaerolineae bacterium]